MGHICSWKVVAEWRPEASEGGWTVLRQHRLQRCSICNKEKSAQAIDRRRRHRNAIQEETILPNDLSKALPEKQWRSLTQILQVLGGNRLDLEGLLEQWARRGWIEIEEHRDRLGTTWEIDKARISDSVHKEFIERAQSDAQARRRQELEMMLFQMQGWRADLGRAHELWNEDHEFVELLDRLDTILSEQEQGLQNRHWIVMPNTNQRAGGSLHQRWVRVFRGLVALLASNEWEYERTFSARWLDDSKQLARDRQPIEDYLGVKFEDLGLFRHTPVVYCWGAFEGQFRGRRIDGRAGVPFIALSAETVRNLIDIQIQGESIFVIENQTAFETVLRNPLRRDGIVYLYSGGHAGLAERELLAMWLRSNLDTPWHVWTDWDVGGVRIQADWMRWANDHSLPAPHAWMWDEKSLNRWKVLGRPLADPERAQLLQMESPLATRLVQAGFTLEQENVLPRLGAEDLDSLLSTDH